METAKVFLFHRVSPIRDLLWDPMDPVLFEEIIRYINKNYNIVSLEDYLFEKSSSRSVRPKVMLTFDDGYRDFAEYALPILRKYQAPVTMYVVTDCVDKNLPPWTFLLDFAFNKTSKLTANLPVDYLPESLRITDWNTAEERISYAKRLKPALKVLPNHERLEIVDAALLSFDDLEFPNYLMLNWSELRELQSLGVILGSHSASHPLMATIHENHVLQDELIVSMRTMTRELGSRPLGFSYPNGSFNERVALETQSAGYAYGLAAEHRSYHKNKDNLFAIPRIELYNEPTWKTRLRIWGFTQPLRKLKELLTPSSR